MKWSEYGWRAHAALAGVCAFACGEHPLTVCAALLALDVVTTVRVRWVPA